MPSIPPGPPPSSFNPGNVGPGGLPYQDSAANYLQQYFSYSQEFKDAGNDPEKLKSALKDINTWVQGLKKDNMLPGLCGEKVSAKDQEEWANTVNQLATDASHGNFDPDQARAVLGEVFNQ